MPTKFTIGQKINRITLLEYHGKQVWTYRCDCGKQAIRQIQSLKNAPFECKSCAMKHNRKHTPHGQHASRLNQIWRTMKFRCSNPNASGFQYYGGKGIQVCPEWQNFIPFQNWALNNGYQENLTIERKDPNKNYCPENCVWIPQAQQQQTSANAKQITVNNETHNLADWCRLLKIHRNTLKHAMKTGWPAEIYIQRKLLQQTQNHERSN